MRWFAFLLSEMHFFNYEEMIKKIAQISMGHEISQHCDCR